VGHLGAPRRFHHRPSLRASIRPARPDARDEAESWDLDWKFLEVRRAVERDPRPFVWIDDDLDFF
jgi:hypothetical protein